VPTSRRKLLLSLLTLTGRRSATEVKAFAKQLFSVHPFKEIFMKLRPLHDRVIVKRLEQETKTASGIVIPDNAAEKPDQGEVLAVGPGKRSEKGDFIALNIKVGDRVLFGKYSGQTVKVDGDELLVMREEDLFAVVEKK
jgi:chaperonin GroES